MGILSPSQEVDQVLVFSVLRGVTIALLVLIVGHQRIFWGTEQVGPLTYKTSDPGQLEHHKDGSHQEAVLHWVFLLLFCIEIQIVRWSWSHF